MLAMSEPTLAQILTPELRERLAVVATVAAVRPTASFLDEPEALAELGAVEVLLTGWGCPPITAAVLDAAPRLRAILHAAGSVKHIVDPSAFDRGIQVSSAAGANAVPVAEYAVGAIVLGGKRAFRLAAEYRTFRIKPHGGGITPMGNHRSTVGLLGASRIGRLVAERLCAFDFEVLISDPYLSADDAAALGAKLCDLDTLFAASDVLSIHAPLLPETTGLVDARLLGLLRDGAVLVNTARGKIIDAAALEAECRSGRIDAVLDVTDPEPLPPDSPLLDLPNVFVTPHLAGALGNEIARLGDVAVSELERLVAGLPLEHAIDAHELGRIA